MKTTRLKASQILLLGKEITKDRMLLTNLHRSKQYQVQAPTDSTHFLNDLSSSHFDMIVLEIEETFEESLNSLKLIKRKNPSAKVIVVSGGESIETVAKAFNYGATDFFRKPLNVELLSERISYLLS